MTKNIFSQAKVKKLLKAKIGKESKSTITFWYGGWSLKELKNMCPDMFREQYWYDDYKFIHNKSMEGMYTVDLKVPDSNNKTFSEQEKLIGADNVCPIVIVATALIISLKSGGKDPLNGDFIRCKDTLPDGERVALGVSEGRVGVSYDWDGLRDDGVFGGGARKL